MTRAGKVFAAAAALVGISAPAAWAHAAEQGFVLLLPTGAYSAAGTAAVVASIVLVTGARAGWLARIFAAPEGRAGGGDRAAQVTSVATTALFFGLVYIGLNGPSDPQRNLLPLTIWTVWWVGLVVVQGVGFDVWRWLHPWRGLYQWLAADIPPVLALPARWSVWPAVGVFALFQLFVLADIAPSDPRRLATLALIYWAVTFVGMVLCGGQAWLRQVECFSVLMRLIGSLRAGQGRRVGVPGWSSIAAAPLSVSGSVFCLMVLASGSFDGLSETFWWLAQIGINPLEFPGRSAVVLTSSLGLIGANVALIAVYAAALWIGQVALRVAGGPAVPFGPAFRTFAVAFLPIALGYHIAHYLVSFMVQIQYFIAALGDPLVRGWSLLGLAEARVTTGFLNTAGTVRTLWLSQAVAVVLSHVLSVLMAHHLAARLVQGRRDLMLVQLGLSALMIAYTFFGLWLLATPRGA